MDSFQYNDVNVRLSLYNLSRQKKILGLLETKIFCVVNAENILVGIQIFNL